MAYISARPLALYFPSPEGPLWVAGLSSSTLRYRYMKEEKENTIIAPDPIQAIGKTTTTTTALAAYRSRDLLLLLHLCVII